MIPRSDFSIRTHERFLYFLSIYNFPGCDNHQDNEVDLDRIFLQNLRDLKLLLEKEYIDELKK